MKVLIILLYSTCVLSFRIAKFTISAFSNSQHDIEFKKIQSKYTSEIDKEFPNSQVENRNEEGNYDNNKKSLLRSQIIKKFVRTNQSKEGVIDNVTTALVNKVDTSVSSNSTEKTINILNEEVDKIIANEITKLGLFLQKIQWNSQRIEVIVTMTNSTTYNGLDTPSLEAIEAVHRSIYRQLEALDTKLGIISKYELIVASPGIGEVLVTDQDFISFQGFPVTITTSIEFKKKSAFEGTLMERTDEYVSFSQKGRIIRIPRNIVSQVKLPPSKYESTDTEIRKLR